MSTLKGKRVVVRAPGSGVFFGTLARMGKRNENGLRSVTLTNVQRVWRWDGGALDTLAIAAAGITAGKLSPPVSSALIGDAREIIEMSPAAEDALAKVGPWRA